MARMTGGFECSWEGLQRCTAGRLTHRLHMTSTANAVDQSIANDMRDYENRDLLSGQADRAAL